MKNNILSIGYGEIGSSVKDVYDDFIHKYDVYIEDKFKGYEAAVFRKYDIIEICLPFKSQEEFIDILEKMRSYLKYQSYQFVL